MAIKHYVHRFKYSHDRKRKAFKRLRALGAVKLIKREYTGWLYEETEGNNITITSKGNVLLNNKPIK